MKVFLVLSSIIGLMVNHALGEVELVCPKPMDPSSTTTTYTELTPGPRTIVFRETRSISGAPFKLSIMRNAQECVLLDHIPSQRTENGMYYVTVNIPNFVCNGMNDNCRLMLWQIDTSSNGYCDLNPNSMNSCPTYNSSAPISIRRNQDNVACPARRNNYNEFNWPFDPVRRYTSTIVSDGSTGRATGTFHRIGHTILYNVNVTVPFSGVQPQSLRFVYFPEGSTDPMVMASIDIPTGQTGVMGSWTEVTDFAAFVFWNMTMYAQVLATDSSDETESGLIMGRIVRAGQNGADNVYGMEYGMYAADGSGWLAGEMFVGAGANATLFTQPHGPCSANFTRYFGCMLSGGGGMQRGGTVAVSLTGTRMWFSMDMYNLSSPIMSVSVDGTAVEGIDLTPFWSDGARLRGLADITDSIQGFVILGSATVSVSTAANRNELTCTLEEGIIGILDSFYEVPSIAESLNSTGTAFMFFSVDGAFNFQITLNSLSSQLVAGHLHGPANQGQASGNIPLDMSQLITGDMEGGWNIMGMWMNLTANELRYFVENLYYLNLHTTNYPSGELRGQVSILGDWICPPSTDDNQPLNQCYWPRLSLVPGVDVNSDRTPMAVGAAVIDRAERLQYSIAFWYLPMNPDEELTVRLTTPEESLQSVSVDADDDSDIRANVREIYSVYPSGFNVLIPDRTLRYFENGEVWFNVTSPSYPGGLMSGYLPRLSRNKCTGMPYNVSVGGDDGWIPLGNEYPDMRVLQGDNLKFTFSTPDDVYEMENANRLAGCVFTPSTATLLADAETVSPNTYYYALVDTGEKYFSSRASCQNQQMRLTTFTVAEVPESQRMNADVCSRSLYSTSQDQRSSSSSALAGAITATIVGLIIGTIIAAVAIVIGVYVMIKGKVNSGDSGDLEKKA